LIFFKNFFFFLNFLYNQNKKKKTENYRLENGLRNFACLNVGDTISIKYNKKIYQLKVLETKPHGAISIIEADIEVDFAPPPGYVEPSYVLFSFFLQNSFLFL